MKEETATEFFTNECIKRFTNNGQFTVNNYEKLGKKILIF